MSDIICVVNIKLYFIYRQESFQMVKVPIVPVELKLHTICYSTFLAFSGTTVQAM